MQDQVFFIGLSENYGQMKLMKRIATERKDLANALENLDLSIRLVSEFWPRDVFNYHDERINRMIEHGNYADGGYVISLPKLTIACDGVGIDKGREISDSPKKAREKLKRLYQNDVEIFPNPDFLGLKQLPHVDLIALPIPERNILFLDSVYYKANQKFFNNFCEQRGFKLETADCDYAKPTWPCNGLVLSSRQDIRVVCCAQKDRIFASKLANYDIQCLEVPFAANCSQSGSIHCATNSVPKRFEEEAYRVFYE